MKPNRLIAALAMSLCFAVALGGCAVEASEPLTLDQIGDMGMPTEQKQTDLPAGFPLQVPVIAGEVLLASDYDQGNGVWLYDIATEFEAPVAVEWYRRTFPIANWQTIGDRPAPGGEWVTLEFAKGDARATVVVRADEDGTIIEASTSLGAPAAETF